MEIAEKKTVALTFDDGPDIPITEQVLDILEKNGITASFFVNGKNITDETAYLIRRAHDMGCEINSHGYTHTNMDKMSSDEIKDDMRRTRDLIVKYAGEQPKFFRPPYIAVSDTLYDSVDIPFICGIGCKDWEKTVSVEKRVSFLTEEIPDGCIILLHDQEGNSQTVAALEQALPVMKEGGYEFVTVSGLFAAKGIVPAIGRGIIYSFATETGK